MRILQVSDHFPPQTGGLAIQVQRLALRLCAAGHDAAVFTAGAPRREEAPGGTRVWHQPHAFGRLPGVYQEGSPSFHPPWPDPEFRAGLRRAVRAFRPDVLHVHGWSVFSAAALGRGAPPILCTLHDYGLRCPKKSLRRHGEVCATGLAPRCVTCDSDDQPTPRRSALAAALGVTSPWVRNRVARFLAVSSYVQERHLEAGLPGGRIAVVPPLIDAVPPGPAHRASSGRPYVLYVGPGDEGAHKGRAVLLRAFARLGDRDHALVLVGGARPAQDAGAVVEDAGYLRGEALAAAFRGASVTVVPSLWADPCPAVAVEALSAGSPVVASAVGGLPDIVASGRTGLLVPPGDDGALAGALDGLLADPQRRGAMGHEARRSVGAYATEAVLPQLVEHYERAVHEARP